MNVPTEVSKLVEGSGNTFHAKVASWFRTAGWEVLISPYYMDHSHGKAREIDFIAEKAWPISDLFGREVGDVVVRLFVECKYIPSFSVLWFADKDLERAEKLICKTSCYREENRYTREHHYFSHSPRVAKVFASTPAKEPDSEPLYKALNQVLNAFVSMRGRAPILRDLRERGSGKFLALEVPVVVCNSFEKFYGVDFFNPGVPSPLSGNFLMELEYAYVDRSGANRQDDFLVDFVCFNSLQEFVDQIEKDAKGAAYLSRGRQ